MGRIAVIQVDKDRRKTILALLIVQNFIALSIGFVMSMLAIYVRTSLEAKISFLGEYYNPSAVPGVLGLTGLLLVIASIFGIRACFKSRHGSLEEYDEDEEYEGEEDEQKKEKKDPDRAIYPFFVMSVVVLVMLVFTDITFFAQISAIEKALHKGITSAMAHYKTNLEMKKEFDFLQIKYRCCGMKSYEDWFKIDWIDKKHKDEKNLKKLKHGRFNDDVPFSCCNINNMSPCISERVQEDKAHYRYDYTVNLTLYTRGCKSVLSQYFGHIVFKRIGVFVCLIVLLQFCTVAACRYLQTSTYSMTENEEPVVGWLITWGEEVLPEKEDEEDEEGSTATETDVSTTDVSTTDVESDVDEEETSETDKD